MPHFRQDRISVNAVFRPCRSSHTHAHVRTDIHTYAHTSKFRYFRGVSAIFHHGNHANMMNNYGFCSDREVVQRWGSGGLGVVAVIVEW
jgi:hypothetical protein